MTVSDGSAQAAQACIMIAAMLLATAQIAPSEITSAAARSVIQRYYAAIDRADYSAAYRLWSDGGRASGTTLSAFAAGFAHTRHAAVVAGTPTRGEGAAGSVFVTVPVRVDALLKDGTRQRFAGRYVLRRVNGVDGASPEQLRWHIASARLLPVR